MGDRAPWGATRRDAGATSGRGKLARDLLVQVRQRLARTTWRPTCVWCGRKIHRGEVVCAEHEDVEALYQVEPGRPKNPLD